MRAGDPPGYQPPRRAPWRLGTTRALKAALLNLAAGFGSVGAATIFARADLAAVLTAATVPPLLTITLFHALRDLLGEGRDSGDRLQAWLALLLSLVPVGLLFIFFVAAVPEPLRTILPWRVEEPRFHRVP